MCLLLVIMYPVSRHQNSCSSFYCTLAPKLGSIHELNRSWISIFDLLSLKFMEEMSEMVIGLRKISTLLLCIYLASYRAIWLKEGKHCVLKHNSLFNWNEAAISFTYKYIMKSIFIMELRCTISLLLGFVVWKIENFLISLFFFQWNHLETVPAAAELWSAIGYPAGWLHVLVWGYISTSLDYFSVWIPWLFLKNKRNKIMWSAVIL